MKYNIILLENDHGNVALTIILIIVLLEACFKSLPNFCRHVIFAPSQHDSYAGSSFPGLADSLFDIERRVDADKWNKVKQQLAAVTYIIEAAATTIEKDTEF